MNDLRYHLHRLCPPQGHSCSLPFLRRRGKTAWTVATDGCALLVVRGAFTDNVGGPNVRPVFRMKWNKPRSVKWPRLFAEIRERAPVSDHRDSEPVKLHGVTLNLALLRRFARGLKADTVTLRASKERIKGSTVSTAECLRIDARDWTVLVMAMLQEPKKVLLTTEPREVGR